MIQQKTISSTLFQIHKVVQWLQALALMFSPGVIESWGQGPIMPYFKTAVQYVHISPVVFGSDYKVFLGYTIALSFLNVVGLGGMVFVSRENFRGGGRSWVLVGLLRGWIELTQGALLIPILLAFLAQVWPNPQTSTLQVLPNIHFLQGTHLIGFASAVVGLVAFVPVALIGCFFCQETDSHKSNAISKRPDLNSLILVVFVGGFIISPMLYSEDVSRVLLPIVSSVLGIFFMLTRFRRTAYYSRRAGRVEGIASLIFLWTAGLCTASAIAAGSMGSLIEVWAIGVPVALLIGLVGVSIQLKPLYSPTNSISSAGRLMEQVTLLLQLLNEEESDESVKMLLDGFVEMHIENCEAKDCPIQPLPRKPSESETTSSVSRETRLLALIEFLLSEGVKKFENSISLRLNYVSFLVDRLKKRQLALTELKILEELRPSGQEAFFLYFYQKKITEYSESEVSDDDSEINEVAYEVLVSSLLKSLDLLCCFYFEYWALLNEELPVLFKISSGVAKIQNELHRLEKVWTQLTLYSPCSKFKYTSLLSRFFTNIANDFEKGEALMAEARAVTTATFEKKSNIMNFRLTESISDVSSPIVVISATIESLGVITEINQAASAFFRFNSSELLGKNINILLPRVIKDFHQGYLKKAFVDKKKSFNREKPLFARGKDGYLLQIYLTVKLLAGQRNSFLGRVRTAPVSGFMVMILTDEDGIIDSFSPNCEFFFRLDSNEMAQRKKIDSLIPNASKMRDRLVNRGLVPAPEELQLAQKDFNVSIDLSSYSHANMDSSYYVYRIVMERVKREPKESVFENAGGHGDFCFTLHASKKKMVAGRGVGQHDGASSSQSQDSDDFGGKEQEKLGEGINTCRLEKGELMHVIEGEGEEVESNNDDEEMRRLHIVQQDEQNRVEEERFAHYFSLKKPEFRKTMGKMKTPLFVKIFAAVFFTVFVAATISATVTMQKKIDKLGNLSNYFKALNSLINLTNFIQRGVNMISIRFSKNPGFFLNRNETSFMNAFSANLLDLEICEKQIQENSNFLVGSPIADLFSREDITMELTSGRATVSFWSGLKNIITQSFALKQVGAEPLGSDPGAERMKQFQILYQAAVGSFFNRTRQLRSDVLSSSWDSLDGDAIEYLPLGVYIGLLLLGLLVIFIFQKESMRKEAKLLMLLVEIRTNRIRHFCRKCELFREIVFSGENEDPLDLEYLINDVETESSSRSQRSRLKKLKKSFKFSIKFLVAVSIIFAIFISFFLGFSLYYRNGVQKSRLFINELISTASLESEFLVLQNKFYSQIYFPELTEDKIAFNTESINFILELIARVMKDQIDTIQVHSDAYNDNTVGILSSDLCSIWFSMPKETWTQTPSGLFQPTLEQCEAIKQVEGAKGLILSGFLFSIVTYLEIVRKMMPLLTAPGADPRNTTQMFENVWSIPVLSALVEFHFLFYAEILAGGIKSIFDDIDLMFTSPFTRIIYAFLATNISAAVLFSLAVVIPFLRRKNVDFGRVEFALLGVPDEDLKASKTLRTFVLQKLKAKIETTPALDRASFSV